MALLFDTKLINVGLSLLHYKDLMWVSTKPRGSAPATPVAPPLWPRSIRVLSASLSPAAGAETPPQLPDPPDMMRENDNRATSCPQCLAPTPLGRDNNDDKHEPLHRLVACGLSAAPTSTRRPPHRLPTPPPSPTDPARATNASHGDCPQPNYAHHKSVVPHASHAQTNATTIARAPHVAASNHQWPSSRTTMSMTSHALLPIIMPSWRCV